MAHLLMYMDWTLVIWTALNWMFAGGILYLVYKLGSRSAVERGLKIYSWRTVALLLGFVVCVAMYGTDYPDQGLILEFGHDDWAVFLGIFLIVTATYSLGYLDSFLSTRSKPAQAVIIPDHPAS